MKRICAEELGNFCKQLAEAIAAHTIKLNLVFAECVKRTIQTAAYFWKFRLKTYANFKGHSIAIQDGHLAKNCQTAENLTVITNSKIQFCASKMRGRSRL